jgi:hypothetical protein
MLRLSIWADVGTEKGSRRTALRRNVDGNVNDDIHPELVIYLVVSRLDMPITLFCHLFSPRVAASSQRRWAFPLSAQRKRSEIGVTPTSSTEV